jgi:hypothetical protein
VKNLSTKTAGDHPVADVVAAVRTMLETH